VSRWGKARQAVDASLSPDGGLLTEELRRAEEQLLEVYREFPGNR
jgi:hypothetical protein